MLIDPYSAHFAVCLKSFKIDNQGVSQVKSYAICHETNNKKKDTLKSFLAQRTIDADDGNLNLTEKDTCILSAGRSYQSRSSQCPLPC